MRELAMKQKLLFGLLLSSTLAGCGDKRAPTAANFARGLRDYLRVRGDLCLGLSEDQWPIDVWPGSAAVHDRNALQLPVLQKLGLVAASDAVVDKATVTGVSRVPVRRYRLTDAGRTALVKRPGLAGGPGVVDLCAAKLSLDKVASWELTGHGGDQRGALVHYTYNVEAAPWTRDPDARRVFPMVDRVIRGAGSAQLEEGFTLTANGWVANELVPAATPAVARGP